MIIQGNDPFTGPSFTLLHRVVRQLWTATWLLAFRPSPRFVYPWRNVLLRLYGARLGRHVHFHPSVRVWAPWNLRVGDYVGFGEDAVLYSMEKIVIGDHAVISQGTHLCGGSHDYNSPNFQLYAQPITIDRWVWLCAESFVALGVTVAEGCVVGARAVVVRSIEEPWTVWAGVPARRVGSRSRSIIGG